MPIVHEERVEEVAADLRMRTHHPGDLDVAALGKQAPAERIMLSRFRRATCSSRRRCSRSSCCAALRARPVAALHAHRQRQAVAGDARYRRQWLQNSSRRTSTRESVAATMYAETACRR